MPRLSGLTSLYGNDPALTPAGTIDEGALQAYEQSQQYAGAHSKPGDTANQQATYGGAYGGQGTYGVNESGQLADFNDIPGYFVLRDLNAPLDDTPSSHGGKYPRPMALSVSAQSGMDVAGEQSRLLHGVDEGGVRALLGRAPGGHEEMAWTVDRYDAPNESAQAAELSGQLKAGNGPRGSADTVQGYGVLNTLPEFQAGHSIRYVQHDRLQFDTTLTGPEGEEGTWLGRFPVGTGPSFDGPDSPYGKLGDSERLMLAENRGYPTEYAQVVAPKVLPPVTSSGSGDVWASGGF